MSAHSAGPGRLPTFFIIGAPKAGSTAMADYLRAHPDVFIPPEKEIYFFDLGFARGVDWYRAQFADVTERAVGDATPTYLYSDMALERMASIVPGARLIAILRNPVDRAYSAYWWRRSLQERRPFDTIARAEMEQGPSVHPRKILPYLTTGRYLIRLKRVCDFYSRESLLVLILEDLLERPPEVFAETCRFLGVDDASPPPELGKVVNPSYRLRWPRLRRLMFRTHARRRLPGGWADAIDRWNRVPWRYPPMDDGLRSELRAWFAEDNAALAHWLGKDLSAWDR